MGQQNLAARFNVSCLGLAYDPYQKISPESDVHKGVSV